MMTTDDYQYADTWPEDALAGATESLDVIDAAAVGTLPAAFTERLRRSADSPAYLQWTGSDWREWTWGEVGNGIRRWQAAFAAEGLAAGERVAIRLRNCVEWVLFDQGAMTGGLVVVPVFAEDRDDNIAYIIGQTGARVLLVESAAVWRELQPELAANDPLKRVVLLSGGADGDGGPDDRVIALEDWLEQGVAAPEEATISPDDLATIVFTSGTTGKPKGVMLSHANILGNAHAGLRSFAVLPTDRMLSFLPLSHMFERTIGCYLNVLAGSSVAFNRSIPELLEDMATIRPTILITVPRVFERAYSRIRSGLAEGPAFRRWLFERAVETGWERFEARQGRGRTTSRQWFYPLLDRLVGRKVRARFGGRLRAVVSGGAPLAPRISRVFIALGVDILQGYGLTESSPVLSVNTLKHNKPESIGLPMIGTEIRVAPDGELQARGPGVMLGYWNNPEATAETMTDDGWLKTGDVAAIDGDGFISITGRIKEIIVLATGEKVPPADMESAICDDPVFEQCMVVGEGRPFLSLVAVVDPEAWRREVGTAVPGRVDDETLKGERAQEWAIARVAELLHEFPGYADIHRVTLTAEPWTVEGGALTPTLKAKRPVLRERFNEAIEEMYEGH